jgi:hypothetical protein
MSARLHRTKVLRSHSTGHRHRERGRPVKVAAETTTHPCCGRSTTMPSTKEEMDGVPAITDQREPHFYPMLPTGLNGHTVSLARLYHAPDDHHEHLTMGPGGKWWDDHATRSI